MTYRYWPLFDLRLATPGLALLPTTEADLAAIADLLPDDVEQDPAATAYDVGNARTGRGIIFHQSYWKAYGTWRPSAWRLNFVVRALAFGPLQAQAAITSAWHDSHASLGVSRALGYRPNGESLHARGNGVDVMRHMRLRRAGWLASGTGDHVLISGFEACRPLFGLPAR
jgi:hypothetical protein